MYWLRRGSWQILSVQQQASQSGISSSSRILNRPAERTFRFYNPKRKGTGRSPYLYHACGMQHNDGWKSCKKISKPVRARIGKLVKAGVFEDASAGSGATKAAGVGQPTKQKRGTANAVVEEEDDGEKNGGRRRRLPSPRASSSDAWNVKHSCCPSQ